jgi:hypothetical protein
LPLLYDADHAGAIHLQRHRELAGAAPEVDDHVVPAQSHSLGQHLRLLNRQVTAVARV